MFKKRPKKMNADWGMTYIAIRSLLSQLFSSDMYFQVCKYLLSVVKKVFDSLSCHVRLAHTCVDYANSVAQLAHFFTSVPWFSRNSADMSKSD